MIRASRTTDPGPGRSSAELLARFADTRDEQAFAELVRRYGRMVLAVCRRGAGHPQDAEDAFQAVFLVLARKAGRVGRPDALGSWLYGVAVRVAGRARRAAARRARREVTAAELPDRGTLPPEPEWDLQAVVERELAALPARLRRAVELCDLGGLTRAEAAEAMGVPEGTVSSRLTTGRGLLAARLARRGVTLGAGGLVATPAADAAGLAGPTVARVLGGSVGEHVRALARWGAWDMGLWMRWAGVLTAAGATVGAGAAWGGRPVDDPLPPPAAKEVAKATEPTAKAPASGRPRMTHRVEFPDGNRIAAWSADGSHLAIEGDKQVRVFDARRLKDEAVCKTGPFAVVVGFLPDSPVLVTYRTGRGQINQEKQLQFFNVRAGGLVVGPERQVAVDGDPGHPVTFLDGGRTILTEVYLKWPNAHREREGPGYAGLSLQTLDPATGEIGREVLRFESPVQRRWQLSPDGKSVAVVTEDTDTVRLERWELGTAKRLWGVDLVPLPAKPRGRFFLETPVFSPDGSTPAVSVPRPPKAVGKPPRPDWDGAELRLFAAADGAARGRPDDQSEYLTIPHQFSHDGRLLLGRRNGGSIGDSLSIWDVRTGRLVKGWPSHAPAMFAPDRPVLAILEDTSHADGNIVVKQAVLAVWDVSDLVK
ncbi:MAG: sigma-70 family RNA polymerase sigma factor [Gemmataceae bacterium]|nr:sigma-70 family RNA polymerase sigma factor [Gemmataceae bacterium]